MRERIMQSAVLAAMSFSAGAGLSVECLKLSAGADKRGPLFTHKKKFSMDSNAVADYLLSHPQFFEEHAELLSRVRLSSVLGGRTLSLQERQVDLMRKKLKTMELRLVELIRIGEENDNIMHKFQFWTRDLLRALNNVDLPQKLMAGLQGTFNVPHVTLRLWGVAEEFAHAWFAAPVSDDSRLFAGGMTVPFCGPNNDFEATTWFQDAPETGSVALIPLRTDGSEDKAFGLLVLGSPDANRFTTDMETDFLNSIGKIASAALASLLE